MKQRKCRVLGRLAVACAAVLTVTGAAQGQISGFSVSTSGSAGSPGNDGDGFTGFSVAKQIETGTQIRSRYAFNVNADVGIFSTRDQYGTAQHNMSFNVTTPGGYRLDVTQNLVGGRDVRSDASGCDGSTNMSSVSGSQTGGSSVTGSLSIGAPPSGSFSLGANASIYGVSNGVTKSHTLTFSWTANVRSNSCEAAVRLGEQNGSTTDCEVCGYPGNPSRTQANDGHFVTVTFNALCGNGVIDTVVGEQCDPGISGSVCCTANCTFASSSTVCRSAAGECDAVEFCTGTAATCPTDAKKAAGTACTDDGKPCRLDICDGTSNFCTHPIAPNSTICRPSVGVCDVTDYCDGFNETCPPDQVAPPDTVCRGSQGECDVVDYCTGTSAVCPPDAKSTGLCRGAAGDCDLPENCDGVSNTCPENQFKSFGTVCRGPAGDCDQPETCTGTSASCPPDAKRPAGYVCRAAVDVCDIAETCPGNSDSCPGDAFRPSTYTCRTAAGACDVAETCTGASTSCPPDQVAASGTVCRAATGGCDVAEVCDGAGVNCPSDGIRPAGYVCRGEAGPCDIAEECDGASKACPADEFRPNTVECRPKNGVCDVEEYCPGTGPNCPSDAFAGGTVECRPSAGPCDPAEFCDATGPNCPADQRSPTTQLCRNIQGPCDVAEYCDGVSPLCPTDQFKGATTQCRAATGACDVAEYCDGTGPACPPDAVAPDTVVCRPAGGVCDVDDYCDGATKGCPADQKKLGDECRPADGACDVAEYCDGANNDCPADAVAPASTVCRPVAGVCDVAENCNGVDPDCPADTFKPATVVCRPAADGSCDVAEYCTGTGASCPADTVLNEGDGCAGSDGNTCMHTCRSGVCVDEVQPNCCGNGIPDVGEQCDDGDQELADDECPSGPGQNCQYANMVRGTRKNPAKDKYGCLLQWHVAHSSLLRDKFGLPDRDQACRDNDPTCDFDPTPGVCGFRVTMCLNTTDSTLACAPSTGVTAVTVKPVSQAIASDPILGPLAVANVNKVATALGQLLDPQDPGAGYSKGLPLLASQKDWCSQPLELKALVVQTVKDRAKRRVVIRTKAFDGSLPRPKAKASMLRLTCYP